MIASLLRCCAPEKPVESALPIAVVEGAGVVVSRNRKLEVIGDNNNVCNNGKSTYFYVCHKKEKKLKPTKESSLGTVS